MVNDLKNRIRFFVNLQKTRIDEGRGASRLYTAKIRELKKQWRQQHEMRKVR